MTITLVILNNAFPIALSSQIKIALVQASSQQNLTVLYHLRWLLSDKLT